VCSCVAEKLSLDAATAAAVPGVDTHKERGGEIIPHLDSQAVSDRSAVLCPSHGRNDRITPVYSCLFSTNRSYTVCYYAALYHHICLQNVIYHDLKDDDDARQHHVKEHSVAAAENLSTDRASAEHDDITKKADLMNVNKSIPLRSHKTSMPATDAEAATDNVPADESVSATAAVGKTSNTSTTANMTQKSSRTKKNVKATAAKRTAGETKATSKTNSTTASGNSRTPAPVNKTTKLTYKDLVKSITSSTGNKLSNSEKSNVDAESNTNNSNCVNQRAVATEATPTDVHRSQRHTDRLSPDNGRLSPANRSHILCYYAAMFRHICLQNVCYHDIKDDYARPHFRKHRSAAEAQMLAADRTSAGHEDITKKTDSNKINKTIPLSSHETSMPSTDAHDVTDNVLADENVSSAATTVEVSNISTTANRTQQSTATKRNEKVTTKTVAVETEATTKTNATTTNGNNTTSAPVNQTTETKLTYEHLAKLTTSSICSKFSNSKKPKAGHKSSTSSGNGTNQRAVATDPTPTILHSSPVDGGLFSANRSYTLRYYAAMFHHVCLQNAWHHDVKDDYARPHLRKQRSVAEAEILAADRTSAGHEDITKQTDSKKINKSTPLSIHETLLPSTDAHDVVADNVRDDESVSAATTTAEVSNISTTVNGTQQSTASKRNEKVTTKTAAVDTEATTKTNATTTNGNNTTAAPVNQTTETKLTYEHLVKLTTSSICSKFSNSKKPKAGHKSSTSSGNGTNQRAVATDPTPTILHSSPVDGGLFSANRSYTLRYYAAMFHHVCLQNAWHNDVKDDYARPHLRKQRLVAEAEILAADRTFAGHEDITKQTDSKKINKSTPLSSHETLLPSTDVHDVVTDNVRDDESVSAATTTAEVSNISATVNGTQQSTAGKRNEKVTAETASVETEATTKTDATTTNGNNTTSAPDNQKTETKLTYEHLVKLTTSSICSKFSNSKKSKADHKSSTSSTNGTSQPAVTTRPTPPMLHSSPVDGGLFSANRCYTLRYYAAMFHHVCLQNAWHHDVKDDDDARQNLLKLRSVAEAETSAANRSFATHEDATKQLDSMKMDRSIPLNNHKISMPVTNIDVTDYISLACESVAATSIASKTSTSSATANTVQKSPATKNSGKATAIKTTAGEIETTTKTEATTTNGSFPIPSPVSKMSATKQTSEVRVKSMSSAGSKRRNWQPDVDAKSHTSTTNNISQREVAKNQKPSTSGIGSFVSPSDSSVVSGKPTVKELDLLKRNEIWLTDNAESLAKYGTVEVKSKDQRQRVGSTAEDGEEADAEKYATLVENDGTANRRTSRHDVDDQCDQQLRMRSLGTKLLQLENQLLQSAVDRASDVTVTVKLENYIMRLERELMESNHNFVEMKRENEELRQKNLEAAAATNDGDQHRKVDALTSIINNQSISLVALQDKYTGLERENRQLVERILNQSLTINKMMLRVETLDQCVQQQRSTETKLLQLENQLLQTAVDRASDMTTTVDLKNHVMRLQRELVGLNENLIEVKTENEQLRQRNLEAAAATNEGDQQRKVDELADIVHNQSSSLDTLQDKYSALERDSRLLVERILNQSLVMNEMMLRVDMMAREQTKQTTELKQRGSDSWTTVAVSHDYANPPIYKTRDGDTPKGQLYFVTNSSLNYSSLRFRCSRIT